MEPMTAEQQAQVNARLDQLLAEVRDLSRRLAAISPTPPAATSRPLQSALEAA